MRPIHSVGTPCATRGMDVSTISASRGADRSAPGNTSGAPQANAASGTPQLSTW